MPLAAGYPCIDVQATLAQNRSLGRYGCRWPIPPTPSVQPAVLDAGSLGRYPGLYLPTTYFPARLRPNGLVCLSEGLVSPGCHSTLVGSFRP